MYTDILDRSSFHIGASEQLFLPIVKDENAKILYTLNEAGHHFFRPVNCHLFNISLHPCAHNP